MKNKKSVTRRGSVNRRTGKTVRRKKPKTHWKGR